MRYSKWILWNCMLWIQFFSFYTYIIFLFHGYDMLQSQNIYKVTNTNAWKHQWNFREIKVEKNFQNSWHIDIKALSIWMQCALHWKEIQFILQFCYHSVISLGWEKKPKGNHTCNDLPDQPEAGVRDSRQTTHALMPVGNIPNHQADPCYSREHFHSHATEHTVAYPVVN